MVKLQEKNTLPHLSQTPPINDPHSPGQSVADLTPDRAASSSARPTRPNAASPTANHT